jgi:hypothetical protein
MLVEPRAKLMMSGNILWYTTGNAISGNKVYANSMPEGELAEISGFVREPNKEATLLKVAFFVRNMPPFRIISLVN